MTRINKQNSWIFNFVSLGSTPIQVHGSLLFFLTWIVFERLNVPAHVLEETYFVVGILFCLLVHEVGHIVAAGLFGLTIRESVLYPFGGVYTLVGEAKPGAVIAISLAGPIMSIIFAALIAPFCDFNLDFAGDPSLAIPLPHKIFLTNLLLALGNLIPAVPLDGGQTLKAFLTIFKVANATQICARLGQVLGLTLFAFGVFYREVLLVLIGASLFAISSNENWIERSKASSGNLKVSDVMSDKELVITFSHGTTISKALTITLKTLQPLFPILHGDDLVGVIHRDKLLQSGAWDLEESYVSSIMEREFDALSPDKPLSEVIEFLQQYPQEAIVVVKDSKLVGLLLRDKIFEYLIVKEIRNANKNVQAQIDDEF